MESKPDKVHMMESLRVRIILIILALVLVVFGLLFIRSYKNLNLSIQDERVKSVEQIGALLSDKVNQLKEVYIEDTKQISKLITNFDINSKEELKNVLADEDEFLLVTEEGRFQALSGELWLIEDDGLRKNILNGSGVTTSFASAQTRGDYWLFSIGIDPVTIDGKTIIGVVKPVSVQEYADVATLCLYDGMGAAYVIDNDGIIIMRPKTEDILEEFNGYNLFSILKQEKISEEEIENFRISIKEQKRYQIVAKIKSTIWLIQTVPGDYGRGIVITIPVSVIAKDTYSHMRQVIILIALIVFLLAGIIMVSIVHILRKIQLAEASQARIRAKNDFLDKMSHDIRTPLNAIVGMHELALRSLDDRSALADYLNKAKRSSDYLISVINDILDMSKIENGKMNISQVPFSMEELLNHVYQMEILAAQNKKIEFSLCIQTPIETDFLGDPVRIRQCLMNLVSNAIKFTLEGGSIRLGYQEDKTDDQNALIMLTVQDTGIGMSEEFRSQMFKPFEQENSSMTSNYPGSGLGLAIVSNLVHIMGGEIVVDSALGKGSEFTIRLPLVRSAKSHEENPEKSEAELMELLKGKRLLFVEDNELNREIGVSLLEQFGLLVDQAENGKIAEETFAQSPAGYYSLIFMDIQMPVRNGYDAARNIRASGHPDSHTIPILALSANAFDEDARKSVEVGMQGHLAKPIDLAELKAALKKYIQ